MAKRRDPNEMGRLLARRRRCGLSWAELAEESGVPRSTLCWWHRRMGGSGTDGSTTRPFVQLVAAPARPVASALASIEIVFDDRCRVVVQPGVDLDHLRLVLQALRS
jgi:hypothetical protein